MRHTDIRVGDRLKLKRHNPYGLAPGTVLEVAALKYRPGYKVPFVIAADGWGAFRPSDFSGRTS